MVAGFISDCQIKGFGMKIILAQPRSFCAGVERAIESVERALALFGAPVYVRHEIVHNRHVIEDLRAKGAIFVDQVTEIPKGARTIFSAHGVSSDVEAAAHARGLKVIDATCPLVSRVHQEAQRYARAGYAVILIGHAGHIEVEGTLGRIDGQVHLVESTKDVEALDLGTAERIAYVTQTTLSVDDTRHIIAALEKRFPKIKGPDVNDICYATQNRQQAVREIAPQVDLMLVLGSANSSNSNRLREIAASYDIPAYLIENACALDPDWLEGVSHIGITAGASAPAFLVDELIERLQTLDQIDLIPHEGVLETQRFKLPAGLSGSA
jgi:4-hydroxy-3-methylbut-2-enyl diphosphate reductase